MSVIKNLASTCYKWFLVLINPSQPRYSWRSTSRYWQKRTRLSLKSVSPDIYRGREEIRDGERYGSLRNAGHQTGKARQTSGVMVAFVYTHPCPHHHRGCW